MGGGHRVDQRLTGLGRVVMKKGGLARVDVTAERPMRGYLVWLLTPKVMDLKVKKIEH